MRPTRFSLVHVRFMGAILLLYSPHSSSGRIIPSLTKMHVDGRVPISRKQLRGRLFSLYGIDSLQLYSSSFQKRRHNHRKQGIIHLPLESRWSDRWYVSRHSFLPDNLKRHYPFLVDVVELLIVDKVFVSCAFKSLVGSPFAWRCFG